MVGSGNDGFASRPQWRNRLIGEGWRRFSSDLPSAWTATNLAADMVPCIMFEASSELVGNMANKLSCPRNDSGHMSNKMLVGTTWSLTPRLHCCLIIQML